MLVVPADAEVDVSTRTEHLDDPAPFGRPSRQPVDLDGVADACSCRCDGIAHGSPPCGCGDRTTPPERSHRGGSQSARGELRKDRVVLQAALLGRGAPTPPRTLSNEADEIARSWRRAPLGRVPVPPRPSPHAARSRSPDQRPPCAAVARAPDLGQRSDQPPCAKSCGATATRSAVSASRVAPAVDTGRSSSARQLQRKRLRASALEPTGPCFRSGQAIRSGPPARARSAGLGGFPPRLTPTCRAKERHAVGIRRVRLPGVGR